MGPFDRFNDRAKRVLALAQDEAIRLKHDYIGPEHLLLGLLREGEGIAAGFLDSLGIDLGRARRDVEATTQRGEGPSPREVRLDPRTQRVVETAVQEAQARGDATVGTEHLLLGLLRVTGEDAGGVAGKVIASLGIASEHVRQDLTAMLRGRGPSDPTSRSWRVVKTDARTLSGPREDMSRFHEQQLTDVLRVIAVGETRTVGEAAVTLLSLELYADGAVAQFLIAWPRSRDATPAVPMPRLALKLGDDRGTDYASRSYGGSGGGGRPGGTFQWRTAYAFTPAIPAGASALTLTVERLAWLGPGEDKTQLVETKATAGHWDWTLPVS
ncbi:MAG: hypothetical protein KGK07_14135 [Chloroflexota bacterium]|nr:hypothetical protein [Chloroflexota bacterium]